MEINHPRYAKDIEHERFNMIEDLRYFSPFIAPHKQNITVTYRAKKLQVLHEQFKQREEVFSSKFYDPIARYLEEFIHLNPLPWFHSKCEVQIHNPLLFEFKNFVLTQHALESWLDNHLLQWLGWKHFYT